MASNCYYCNEPLNWFSRLLGKSIHAECREKQKEFYLAYEDVLARTSEAKELSEVARKEAARLIDEGKLQSQQLGEINLRIYNANKDEYLGGDDFSQKGRDYLKALQSFFELTDEEAESDRLDYIRYVAWIAEGNLPEIDTIVRLKKGEIAHYEGQVQWKHLKTKRKRVAGTRGQSVRVAKGVSFRVGATPGHTQEWEEFQVVDEGKVMITSQRLLFFGAKKNLNIKHEKIMDLEYYTDAIKIHRGTVNPTYFFTDDAGVLFTILSVALNKSQ